MAVELKVPEAGESVTEVELGTWHKKEGEQVAKDELIVEIETDKVTQELVAPADGTLTKVLKKTGETARVGEVVAHFEEGDAPAASKSESQKEPVKGEAKAQSKDESKSDEAKSPAPSAADSEPRIMPAAQRMMEEHAVRAADIEPTGPGGRILKEDVQRHLETASTSSTPSRSEAPRSSGSAPSTASQPAGDRQEEAVPMSPLRRRIAERLVQAQQNAAMLTTFNEVDMSGIMNLRNQYKDSFEKRYGIKLGFMSFFVKACIDALKQFPAVNAEIRDRDIVYKNYYDIGIAVSTEKGLVVPVVRNTERLSFAEIEQTIADFGKRARDGKIKIEELQGGTFTITNGGVFGSLMSTPILNPPQSGVLGMHTIQQRPIAVDGKVEIRPMMYIALTYDHRVIDGREAVSFLKRIKDACEDPNRMLMEV
ncbi:2-oxoglutarate dehydrogenase complex dihydrolipoyllysine-residue succinyltransferase [Phycisphaerales bacterium AB-hyl4]|uniref:Dihydrolipoyllysine-residue succinyltransferase component of 2-oxoglutarate dehydrogenase complex n=1 Tax=Natronomicrosphaera hydrolytica TaxID=3242702 RepID=A0ABV4U520_9BACT